MGLQIGQARCPHCGYRTTTGGISQHVKHCLKNPANQSTQPMKSDKPDCGQHKKDLFGHSDMKEVAEAIGDLSYPTLYELLKTIAFKNL